MKLLLNANVFSRWTMTGLLGKDSRWFLGWSKITPAGNPFFENKTIEQLIAESGVKPITAKDLKGLIPWDCDEEETTEENPIDTGTEDAK